MVAKMNICRENGEYETETNTFPRIEFKRENEYRKSIFSDLGYYLDQLNKLSKDYLSNDEIKEIFKTIRKYERAILSLIYYMDSFFDGLLEIQKIFKKM